MVYAEPIVFWRRN